MSDGRGTGRWRRGGVQELDCLPRLRGGVEHREGLALGQLTLRCGWGGPRTPRERDGGRRSDPANRFCWPENPSASHRRAVPIGRFWYALSESRCAALAEEFRREGMGTGWPTPDSVDAGTELANDEKRKPGGRSPKPIRHYAGDYLQTEFLGEALGPFPAALLGVGMLLGVAIALWVAAYVTVVAGTTAVVGSLFLWGWRRRRRDALRKGYVAERQIGRALEQAITAKGCAIAHNVTAVMDSGDIDHIVATPQSVWVIETKYRRVPNDSFPKVLSRLHACRGRVEALLPRGTPVRSCLVLAYEEDGVKRERDGILVYNNETFRDEFLARLRDERQGPVAVDQRISGTIWRLSRGEAVAELGVAGRQQAIGDRQSDPEPSPMDETHNRFPKAYGRWTLDDDRTLGRLHEAGWDVASLADRLGRRRSAIKSRLRKLARLPQLDPIFN